MRLQFNIGTGSNRLGTTSAWGSSDFRGGLTGATAVVGTNGATFYITGVQLEVGSTATSFDYRPYGTELALCQRYYENVTYAIGGAITTGQAISSSRVLANIPWTVIKRAAPTVSYTGAMQVWNASASSFSPSNATWSNISVNNARLDLTGVSTSPLVAGNASMLYPNSEIVFQISAEL